MREISVDELARWRREHKPFVLLDVRDEEEVAVASIPGSQWIPMGEIPARIGELDPNATIAVLCHLGGRSGRVAAFLTARGFANVANVEGGIDAYAERVEPALARY
jgi:sulfur-carrier protein adenylyltransferase/sulfurtransferase